MSDFTLCAEIVWEIHNFSYPLHHVGQFFHSPEFCVESLGRSKWYLQLYPWRRQTFDGASLFLIRQNDTSGIENIDIKYQLAVLDAEDSAFEGTIYSSCKGFKQDDCFGVASLLPCGPLYKKMEDYLHLGILKIQCKIWSKDSKSSDPMFYLFHEYLPVIECIFSWCTSESCSPSAESKISLTLPLGFKQTALVDLQQVCVNNEKYVEVVIDGDIHVRCSFHCDIRFTGTGEDFLHWFENIDLKSLPYKKRFRPELHFPNTTDDKKTKNRSYELKCVLGTYQHNLKNCQSSRIYYKRKPGTAHTTSIISKTKSEVVGKEYSLQRNISQIYCNGLHSDFAIKVQDKSFPVHSFILTVRSPVLSRMLETNMKESNEKILELDDLDEITVSQILDYMYTDDPGELSSESALKLYYAGDKYDMPGLKKLTSSFLVSNISCGNVCDILELSDRHQDAHLKSTAVEFISEHEIKMMTSDDFRDLSKRNPDLFIETAFTLANLKLKP